MEYCEYVIHVCRIGNVKMLNKVKKKIIIINIGTQLTNSFIRNQKLAELHVHSDDLKYYGRYYNRPSLNWNPKVSDTF